MLCQKCGHVEATVHRNTTVFRQKIEEHLCELCSGSGISLVQQIESKSGDEIVEESVEAALVVPPNAARPKELRLPNRISVRRLAEVLYIEPIKALYILMNSGVFSTLSNEIDFLTAANVCMHCGVTPIKADEKTA